MTASGAVLGSVADLMQQMRMFITAAGTSAASS
jgi:hypothetical protein